MVARVHACLCLWLMQVVGEKRVHHVATLLDTKGPEIRTAMLRGGKDIELKAGQQQGMHFVCSELLQCPLEFRVFAPRHSVGWGGRGHVHGCFTVAHVPATQSRCGCEATLMHVVMRPHYIVLVLLRKVRHCCPRRRGGGDSGYYVQVFTTYPTAAHTEALPNLFRRTCSSSSRSLCSTAPCLASNTHPHISPSPPHPPLQVRRWL